MSLVIMNWNNAASYSELNNVASLVNWNNAASYSELNNVASCSELKQCR